MTFFGLLLLAWGKDCRWSVRDHRAAGGSESPAVSYNHHGLSAVVLKLSARI